jgi:hypothetical protein
MLAETTADGEKMSRTFFPLLLRMLFSKRPEADPHLLSEAVHDALISYLKNPAAFDENRGTSLQAFLFAMARYKLDHKLRTEARRRQHEEMQPWNIFEDYCPDSPSAGEYISEEQNLSELNSEPALNDALNDPKDLTVLKLWFTRETTVGWVKTLELGHLAQDEQEREIIRAKHRIRKKRQRKLKPALAKIKNAWMRITTASCKS